jgi:hypothetical protein
MKTPREVILERHQAAEARLMAIRAEDLAAKANGQRRPSLSLADAAHKFWLEAIWPWRRVWTGVGAAWVVILGMNLVISDPSQPVASQSRPSPEAQAVLQQQEQLLTQLLGTDTPPPPARPKPSGPRSALEPAGIWRADKLALA